jgi:hypothetical protein
MASILRDAVFDLISTQSHLLYVSEKHADSEASEREAADADPDGTHISNHAHHPTTQLTPCDRA